MKKVIYTCLTGGYDALREPAVLRDGWDYVCFTDAPGSGRKGAWELRALEGADAQAASRRPKLLPHRYLPDYDVSLYLDSNIEIRDEAFYDALEACLEEGGAWYGVPHGERDCLYAEFRACYAAGRIRFRDALRGIRRLRKAGWPAGAGLLEDNLILRRHRRPAVRAVDEAWWEAFLQGPRRDQLHLMPLLARLGITPGRLLPDAQNARSCPWLACHDHAAAYKPLYPRPRLLRKLLMPLLASPGSAAAAPVAAPTPATADPAAPDVSVIIVSMNRPDLLFPCLDSLAAQNRSRCEILLCACRWTPENLALLREKHPEVLITEWNEPAGFAENNNRLLRQAAGRYCFVVNDDTLMAMPVIDRLVADLEDLPARVAAVSPKIVFPDGRVQTCGRDPWTPCRYLRHYLHRVDETRPGPYSNKEGLFRSWTLNGACFLVRTDAFRSAGWFDETYTFTPEDIALGHRLNDLGYEVWADADVEITHLAGATAGPMESVIKPTRVRGSLLFYAGGRPLRYLGMGLFIACYEALRLLKWTFADRSDPQSHAAIMHRTARNVLRSIFTRHSTKEIFLKLLKETR